MLLDLDPYGGGDPDGMFPNFYKQMARKLAPKLAEVFSPGYTSAEVGDYRRLSITPLLSKVFEKIVARKLNHFLESYCLLPPPQISYRRGLTCDALLTLFHHLQGAFDRGMERNRVQLHFSAAFDRGVTVVCCIS